MKIVVAAGVLGLAGLVACDSGGDATTASDDSGALTTQVDGSTPGDDGGIVVLDAGALSSDAAADDSGAPLGFDSGAPICGFPRSCPTTRGIGTISGDTSPTPNTVTTTGSTSEWISVRVTEDDSSAIGRALSMTAKLTSAAGTDYDMFLYVNDGSAKAECTTVAAQSSSPGAVDTASTSWGEGVVANGKVDSATVTIRVQHITGPCNALAPWKLEVTGHTQ